MRAIMVFTVLVCLVMAGSALAGDPDLVFYFSYDNPLEGDTIFDESDNGHNGTIKGNADQVDGGKRGKGMEFESGSYIDMDGPSFAEEQLPREEMTLCAWVKNENTGGDHAIFNARSADSTWLIHPEIKSGGNFRWLLRSAGGNTIFDLRAGAVDWDTWLHYAGVYDGKTATLYIMVKVLANRAAAAIYLTTGRPERASDITLTTPGHSPVSWTIFACGKRR